ncbi:MAG: TonB-dependent receptor plug domain-containing protein [Ignavibacteria bacterium]|nr:TonB-dependent receptor plug domain-containing protein [Ignavibacteria bacterium]
MLSFFTHIHMLAACIVCSCIIMVFPQNITIKDSISQLPVQDASITSNHTSASIFSNENGIANVSLFNKNDTLTIRHASYLARQFSLNGQKEIYLTPRIVSGPLIQVLGQSGYTNGATTIRESVNLTNEDKAKTLSIDKILSTATSIRIREYGGLGSLKTASSRGLNSENTLVLFNGAPVNDLRSGSFDFSSININAVDVVEYIHGFDIENPFSSGGGVIKLSTQNSEFNANAAAWLKAGSERMQAAGFAIRQPITTNLGFKLSADRSYSANNYPFIFEGKKYYRNNAFYSATFINSELIYTDNNFAGKIFSRFNSLNNGVPGFVVTNNTTSGSTKNEAQTFQTIINADYSCSALWLLQMVTSYNTQKLSFTDPSAMVYYRSTEKDSRLHELYGSLKMRYSNGGFNTYSGIAAAHSSLNNIAVFVSNPTGKETLERDNIRVYSGVSWKPVGSDADNTLLTINIAGSLEKVVEDNTEDNNAWVTSWKFGLLLLPFASQNISILFNYSDDYRMPTYNERFYSSLFQHQDLQKEKFRWFDAAFSLRTELFGPLESTLSYFNIYGTDKIEWLPNHLGFMLPGNIGKFGSNGLELACKKQFLAPGNSISVIYTYTDARNLTKLSSADNSYDKIIRYSPLHRLTTITSLAYWHLRASLTTTFNSESFYTSDNNRDFILDPFFVIDASIGADYTLFSVRHHITVTLNNLNNQEYMIIQSYPMPLQTFLFTYQVEL